MKCCFNESESSKIFWFIFLQQCLISKLASIWFRQLKGIVFIWLETECRHIQKHKNVKVCYLGYSFFLFHATELCRHPRPLQCDHLGVLNISNLGESETNVTFKDTENLHKPIVCTVFFVLQNTSKLQI